MFEKYSCFRLLVDSTLILLFLEVFSKRCFRYLRSCKPNYKSCFIRDFCRFDSWAKLKVLYRYDLSLSVYFSLIYAVQMEDYFTIWFICQCLSQFNLCANVSSSLIYVPMSPLVCFMCQIEGSFTL